MSAPAPIQPPPGSSDAHGAAAGGEEDFSAPIAGELDPAVAEQLRSDAERAADAGAADAFAAAQAQALHDQARERSEHEAEAAQQEQDQQQQQQFDLQQEFGHYAQQGQQGGGSQQGPV